MKIILMFLISIPSDWQLIALFNKTLIYYYHGKKGGLINPLVLAYKVERREDYDTWERKKTVEMAKGDTYGKEKQYIPYSSTSYGLLLSVPITRELVLPMYPDCSLATSIIG